jgi:UDP-glucose 4-epimerase
MRSRVTEARRQVLITGSAGFLGEATLDRVTAMDESILAVAMDTVQSQGPAGETRRFISVVHDIREPMDAILASYDIDTVVHLAFELQPKRDETESHDVNVSSATVYGASEKYTKPFVETDPVNPVTDFSYSEQKVEAEKLLLKYADEHPDCAVSILRGCVVMGPDAHNFIAESLGMRVLPVPAGANPEMQFLHIEDYKSAIEAVLTQRPRGIFNIAGTGTMKWREMVDLAGGKAISAPASLLKGVVEASWKLHLQNRSSSAGLAFIQYPWLVSTEKMASELGWVAKHSSREALESWAASRG